jgi:hypothetical protein
MIHLGRQQQVPEKWLLRGKNVNLWRVREPEQVAVPLTTLPLTFPLLPPNILFILFSSPGVAPPNPAAPIIDCGEL